MHTRILISLTRPNFCYCVPLLSQMDSCYHSSNGPRFSVDVKGVNIEGCFHDLYLNLKYFVDPAREIILYD